MFHVLSPAKKFPDRPPATALPPIYPEPLVCTDVMPYRTRPIPRPKFTFPTTTARSGESAESSAPGSTRLRLGAGVTKVENPGWPLPCLMEMEHHRAHHALLNLNGTTNLNGPSALPHQRPEKYVPTGYARTSLTMCRAAECSLERIKPVHLTLKMPQALFRGQQGVIYRCCTLPIMERR